MQVLGAGAGGELWEPRVVVQFLCSAIPEKSDSFRMETRLFSPPNYFKFSLP